MDNMLNSETDTLMESGDRETSFLFGLIKDKQRSLEPGSKKRGKVYSEMLEYTIEKLLFLSAIIAVVCVGVITVFIFVKGSPALFEIGMREFVLGRKWQPSAEVFGILPMILASIYTTIGAVVMGVPIGILTAVYISEIASPKTASCIRPAIELLASIPSVIYGFFGLLVIVPILDDLLHNGGNSMLAAILVLTAMILPTIISITESSIKAVPNEYREGSLAIGASKMQTIFKVILPAAKSGILTAVILGLGRALGETMAIILVAGNSPIMPESIGSRIRTLTGNIAIEMSYAFGLHQEALFATGVVLFVFIMILNVVLNYVTTKGGSIRG